MTKLDSRSINSGAIDGTAIADGSVGIVDLSSAAMSTLRAAATQNADGLLTSGDKTKLDRLNFPVSNVRLVAKGGSDTVNLGTGAASAPFLTIGAALASISGASVTNQFLVFVDAGLYQEHTLVVPDYVSIAGSSIYSTILEPLTTTEHMIDAGSGTEVGFLTIQNVGSGYAAITQTRAAEYALAHKVSMQDCDIGIFVDATTHARDFYSEYVDMNGTYTHAIKVLATGSQAAFLDIENTGTYPTSTNTSPEILLDGANVSATILASSVTGNTNNVGILVTNGAQITTRAGIFIDCAIGIHADAVGSNPYLNLGGTSFINCGVNIQVDNTTATGNYTGYSTPSKIVINSAAPFFITNKDAKIYSVAKKGGDFASIAAAVNSITDSSSSNRYVVTVGPGVWTEPEINVPTYVSIVGDSIQSVLVQPAANNQHIFNLSTGCEVSFMTLQNVGSGYAAIRSVNAGNFTQSHKISIIDCDIGIYTEASSADTIHYAEHVDFNGTYTHAIHAVSSNGYVAETSAENCYGFPTAVSTSQFLVEGTAASLFLSLGAINGTGSDVGMEVKNGAMGHATAMTFVGCGTAIYVANTGAGPMVHASSIAIMNSVTYDIRLLHPSVTGFFTGSATQSKVSINTSAVFSMSYAGTGTIGSVVLQDLYQGSRNDQLINLSKLSRSGAMMGLVSGGAITQGTGLVLNVAAGSGFVLNKSGSPYYVAEVDWSAGSVTLAANAEEYIYVSTAGVISHSSTRPDIQANILLGRAKADASTIDFFINAPYTMAQYGNRNEEMLQQALGPVFGTGCLVSENATARHLDVGSGSFYYGNTNLLPLGGTNVTFEEYYRKSGGGWNSNDGVSVVDNTKYDDGTGTLATMTAGYYAKHALYLTTNGTADKYFLVYSQAQYATLQLAQAASIPTPPSWIKNSIPLVAQIVMLNGTTNITQIIDSRPRLGFQPASVTSITKHGDLSGLSVDDHTQYLKADGTRSMSGALNMGTQNITNVGTVDDVTVSAHGSRHLPTGADALTTAAPTTALSSSTTNATGTANSLSRSDHTHAVTFPVVNDKVQFEDFMMSTMVAASSPLSWVATILNTGAATLDVAAATDNTFNGRVQVGTGTGNNATGKGALTAYNNVNKLIPVCASGGLSSISFEWRIRIPVLSGTGAITFTSLVGVADQVVTGLPTNGIFFQYTNTVNSGKWVCTTRAGGNSSDITATTVTVVANTWYKLKVTIDSSNNIEFFIDGVSQGTAIGNKPTAACKPTVSIEKSSSTTTSRIIDVDYFLMKTER